jgi:hypothetical protein
LEERKTERKKERKKERRKEKGTKVAIEIEKGWKTISDVAGTVEPKNLASQKKTLPLVSLTPKKVSYVKIESMFFPVREF